MSTPVVIAVCGVVLPLVYAIAASCVSDRPKWNRPIDIDLSFALAAFVALSMVGAFAWEAIDRRACESKAIAMEREFDHDMWTGCLIRTDGGQFVPLDQFRVNEQGEQP